MNGASNWEYDSHFVVSKKMRIFAVDKSTEYHEVINEETAIFASKVV